MSQVRQLNGCAAMPCPCADAARWRWMREQRPSRQSSWSRVRPGEAIGGTANWLRGTGDQFAEKSVGWRFNAASSPLLITGIAIVIVGVLSGL